MITNCQECLNQQIREGFKKKLAENSTKGGGSATGDFPRRKNKNNMVLKHWILHNNQLKTHLFLSIFGWGGTLFQG